MKFRKYYLLLLPIILIFSEGCSDDGDSPYPQFDNLQVMEETGEYYCRFNFYPGIRILISLPPAKMYKDDNPDLLIFYPLPNGNNINQTVGKRMKERDDWHFDIQHIGAQGRYLRNYNQDQNIIIIYLEAFQKSWPRWKTVTPYYSGEIKNIYEYILSFFRHKEFSVMLSGHSGGGRFLFSLTDAFESVPDEVKRISFLDSDYGYDDHYGQIFSDWLTASDSNHLSVLAYNDSVALYKGKRFVSDTGGTWYRSKMMARFLSKSFNVKRNEDDSFTRFRGLNGRIDIRLKKNPGKEIFHTKLVEYNGLIQAFYSGTENEEKSYKFFGERVYDNLIAESSPPEPIFPLPPRSPGAISGHDFMLRIKDIPFDEKEKLAAREILSGNTPLFLKKAVEVESQFADSSGIKHNVKYFIMADYLAIGNEKHFCRVPTGPRSAQLICDYLNATMPTRKLVDDIYSHAEIKPQPVAYYPVGNRNETIEIFMDHNKIINEQIDTLGWKPGKIVAGIKKDVIISSKLADTTRPGHVTIYGWHRQNGNAIQPLTNIHIDWYVDYSHGIRPVSRKVYVDGTEWDIADILKDPLLHTLLNDENEMLSLLKYNPIQ